MELKFKDITAGVVSIHQWYTYEGLIEGLPHDRLNENILKTIHQDAGPLTRIYNCYVLPPQQTPFDIGRDYSFGKLLRLPEITCAIGLQYRKPFKPENDFSELTLILYKDSFNLPFETEILNKIADLTWYDYSLDQKDWD